MNSYRPISLAAAVLTAATCCLGLLGPSRAANAPIPAVEPVPDDGNLPLNSAMYAMSLDFGDLARYGYLEREFYFSGTASTRDQETGAVLKADLPYVSRMVVRMPADPKNFSGNVVMEPFHAAFEKTDMWEQLHRYFTERGDIWVGYTVKGYGLDMEPGAGYFLGGIPMLKAYDPVRYGRLKLEPDMRPLSIPPPTPMPPQSLDLTAQVGALLKSNDPASPLTGFKVKRLYLVGAGINGDVIANYLLTGQHEAWTTPGGGQIFDGYLYGIQFRFPPKPPKNAVHIMYRGTAETSRAAESGFIGQSPNTPSYKVYNIIGYSHINAKNDPWAESVIPQINAVLPQPDATMPALPFVIDNDGQCPNVEDDPVEMVLGALFVRMEKYSADGTPLPESPEPELLPGDPGAMPWDHSGRGNERTDKKVAALKVDAASGNVLGGVRMPWIEAPMATYAQPIIRPMPPAGSHPPASLPPPPEPTDAWPRASKDEPKLPTRHATPFCYIYHTRVPYDKTSLHALYKSYEDYEHKFEAAKGEAVKKGWLLKEDAEVLRPRLTPLDFH